MNPQSLADLLLPCPFCGGEAILSDTNELSRNVCFAFAVVCDATKDGCGATSGFSFKKEEAITAWNTRQSAAEVRGGGWLPIESAPRDGSVFLAWRFYAVAVKWTGDAEYPWEAVNLGSHFCTSFGNNGFVEGDINLTHWQPLPSPPGAAGEYTREQRLQDEAELSPGVAPSVCGSESTKD